MDTIINVALIIVAGLNLIIGVCVFNRTRSMHLNQSFLALATSLGLWILGIAMFRMSTTYHAALWIAQSYYVTAALVAPSLYVFSIYFPWQAKRFTNKSKLLLVVSTVLLLGAIILKPFWLFESVVFTPEFKDVQLNSWFYVLYGIYFLGYSLSGLYHLWWKISNIGVAFQVQIKAFLSALLPVYFMGVSFDLFVPYWNYQLIWVGPLFGIFFSTGIFLVIWGVEYVAKIVSWLRPEDILCVRQIKRYIINKIP